MLEVPKVIEPDFEVLEIEWFDPHAVAESWTDLTQVIAEYKDHPQEVVLSIGYVIHEDRDNLLIASGVTESQVSGVTIIPKVNILDRREPRKKTSPEWSQS